MTIAQVGTYGATSGAGFGATLTGVWHASQPRTAGDLLVAFVASTGQYGSGLSRKYPGIGTPAGWTSRSPADQQDPSAIVGFQIFTKIAVGGDAAPAPVISGVTGSIVLMEFSGVDPSAPFLKAATPGQWDTTFPLAAGAYNSSVDSEYVLEMSTQRNGTTPTHTHGGGFTQKVAATAVGGYPWIGIAQKTLGAKPVLSAPTVSSSDPAITGITQFSLRPYVVVDWPLDGAQAETFSASATVELDSLPLNGAQDEAFSAVAELFASYPSSNNIYADVIESGTQIRTLAGGDTIESTAPGHQTGDTWDGNWLSDSNQIGILVRLTECTPGSNLVVSLQWSNDGFNFYDSDVPDVFTALTAIGGACKRFAVKGRYVRLFYRLSAPGQHVKIYAYGI